MNRCEMVLDSTFKTVTGKRDQIGVFLLLFAVPIIKYLAS